MLTKDSPKDTDYVGIDLIYNWYNFTGEPTAEKIAYGIDKQNMFFGNVFRVAKQVFKQHLTLIKNLKK